MLRPEQKSVNAIRHVKRKFALSGSVVKDSCSGTGATAKARLPEPIVEKFYGFETDGHCVDMMMESLLAVFALQVPSEESHIMGDVSV